MSTMSTDGRAILVDSRRLRLFTLFILYVAQGVPIGLFWFAIPTWMATNGADAADVGYVLGLTAIPWTLKLVNGFIMDRYTWLAMGRRRVWIVGAQMTMIVLLIGAAALAPQASDIVLLGLAGFLVNMATTFQDVAVDGLAVDIMEEDERARASGMMFGGQSIGMALSTALTGMAIARMGPSAAYLLAAGFIAMVTLYVLFLRERAGDIPALTRHFLARIGDQPGGVPGRIGRGANEQFVAVGRQAELLRLVEQGLGFLAFQLPAQQRRAGAFIGIHVERFVGTQQPEHAALARHQIAIIRHRKWQRRQPPAHRRQRKASNVHPNWRDCGRGGLFRIGLLVGRGGGGRRSRKAATPITPTLPGRPVRAA